jgi:hypothetical protein
MDHADSERTTDNISDTSSDAPSSGSTGSPGSKRRRGSRGGQRRRGSGQGGSAQGDVSAPAGEVDDRNDIELPEPMREGRPSAEAAERALVRKPRIGDTMPMPTTPPPGPASRPSDDDGDGEPKRRRRGAGSRAGLGRDSASGSGDGSAQRSDGSSSGALKKGRRRGRGKTPSDGPELDDATLEQRRGRERKTQIAVLEGRNLIEHYVSVRPTTSAQIHGNIYLGKVQNVLPGHGGGLRRHRHPEERRAVPRRRAVRRRRRRGVGGQAPHRGDPEGQADHHLPGHQEPDRPQGRPPHPGGVAAGPVRGADPQLAAPTASPSGCPTTSASACGASSTGSSRPSTASSCAPRPRTSPPRRSSATCPPGAAVGPDRGAGGASRSARRCSTASPTWRCG